MCHLTACHDEHSISSAHQHHGHHHSHQHCWTHANGHHGHASPASQLQVQGHLPLSKLASSEKNSFCSSNDSTGLEEENHSTLHLARPTILRPRSRSLSSPIRSPTVENEKLLVNSIYKERFPKATQQMEERLQKFIEDQLKAEFDFDIASDAVFRFAHHQVVGLAKDCHQKSIDKLITSQYFYEMYENLEKLILEVIEFRLSIISWLAVSNPIFRCLIAVSRKVSYVCQTSLYLDSQVVGHRFEACSLT